MDVLSLSVLSLLHNSHTDHHIYLLFHWNSFVVLSGAKATHESAQVDRLLLFSTYGDLETGHPETPIRLYF